MALKTYTDSLRDSINAATDLLDKHIKSQEQLVRTLHGSFWHEAKRPQKASIENHVYEYLTTMQPALSYNDPRVRIRSARANMADEFGVTTISGQLTMSWACYLMIQRPITYCYGACG
jgi:hypothetical protein